MTDLALDANLLKFMSNAFNKPSKSDDSVINECINEDKTLKWKALKNNQYARKGKTKGIPLSGFVKSSSNHSISSDIKNEENLLNCQQEEDLSVALKTDNINQNNEGLIKKNIINKFTNSSKKSKDNKIIAIRSRRGRSKKNIANAEGSQNIENMNLTSNRSDTKIQNCDDKPISINNFPVSDTLKDCVTDSVNFSDEEQIFNSKKIRRSIRLDTKGQNSNISDDINQVIGNLTTDFLIPVKLNTNIPQENKDKLPKKRGRRSKLSLNTSPSANFILSNELHENETLSKKTKLNKELSLESNKRPLRRIKPTTKILENEELRYEFETKNIARITACTEVNSTPSLNSKLVSPRRELKNLSIQSSITPELFSNEGNNESIKTNNFTKNVVASQHSFFIKSQPKTCPDPIKFLNEIKAAKLNLNKSPEDKKLNKKQQQKLLKQKEKHLEKLGLRRNIGEHQLFESGEYDEQNGISKKMENLKKSHESLKIPTNPKKKCLIATPGSSKNSNDPAVKIAKSSQVESSQDLTIANPLTSNITENINIENSAICTEITNKNENEDNLICSCTKSSQYFTRNTPESLFCCAVDNIEDQKVGCCNQLTGELLNLVRPSPRIGYMILCQDHIKRLRHHNCCAGCGIFCTQGNFVFCQNQHFFHTNCAQKFILNSPYDPSCAQQITSPTLVLKCPHCGLDTPEKTSIVTMKCQTLPVFLPSQKKFVKPAKMSLPKRQNNNKELKRKPPLSIELENLIPESVMNIILRPTSQENSCHAFTSKDMFYAINNDDLERVAEILASGYDIRQKMSEFLKGTCLHLVAHFGTIQMCYLLLCRNSSAEFLNDFNKALRTSIMCSIIGNKVDILKLLIQTGADVTLKGPDGMTALHIAAKFGNTEASEILIESHKSSSNISLFENFINSQDDGGWTAIVWAAELGHTEIVSLLLNNGANTNVTDTEHNSVLHWATSSNHPETISVLLRSTNINCSVQNVNGDTPLHIACRSQHTRICLLLISAGADLMVKNKVLELPFDCIGNQESACARAVGFNMQMRSFGPIGLNIKIVNNDISNGRETYPIQVVRNNKNILSNDINIEADEVLVPDFKYITKSIIIQNSVQIDCKISQMRVCSCSDSCNSDQCQCSTISIKNWYSPEGRLNNEFNYNDPAMIFECNDVCGCNKLICKNRVVQNGVKLPLQVFECDERSKGWGVRSLRTIPRGTFIAEYTGEILTEMEADRRTDDSYFFDLGASEHCIDANYYGNISRFFNHSCSPNIVPVRVYYEHQDFRFPKIAFFAANDIQDGDELCFDYGDKFWSIKQKFFTCQCRLPTCRYSKKIFNENV